MGKRHHATAETPPVLKGWKAIADFMGQPLSVVERWAGDGMPVRREGRYTTAKPDELRTWMAHQIGARTVHIGDDSDFSDELRASLTEARRQRRIHRVK
jgi:hypothetical protein